MATGEYDPVRTFRANEMDWTNIKIAALGSGLPFGKALGILVRSWLARVEKASKKAEIWGLGGMDEEIFSLFVNLDLGRIPRARFEREMKKMRTRWEKGEFADGRKD